MLTLVGLMQTYKEPPVVPVVYSLRVRAEKKRRLEPSGIPVTFELPKLSQSISILTNPRVGNLNFY